MDLQGDKSKSMIEPRTVVEDVENGRRGVVIPDYWGLNDGCKGVQVVWSGVDMVGGQYAPLTVLKVIGPENAKVDIDKCGRGGGSAACIWAIATPTGLECGRFSGFRQSLDAGKWRAKRRPVLMYPDCQTEGVEASKEQS